MLLNAARFFKVTLVPATERLCNDGLVFNDSNPSPFIAVPLRISVSRCSKFLIWNRSLSVKGMSEQLRETTCSDNFEISCKVLLLNPERIISRTERAGEPADTGVISQNGDLIFWIRSGSAAGKVYFSTTCSPGT